MFLRWSEIDFTEGRGVPAWLTKPTAVQRTGGTTPLSRLFGDYFDIGVNFGNCAWIQAMPVVSGPLFGRDLEFGSYGVLFVWFGAVA